jgi:Arc/MetJ-type ribon-helix-helix transcriptional regulator
MKQRATSRLTVELPVKVKKLLEERAKAGNYDSPGELVSELFVEMLEREERERVEQLLLEAVNDPNLIPWTKKTRADLLRQIEEDVKHRKAQSRRRGRSEHAA